MTRCDTWLKGLLRVAVLLWATATCTAQAAEPVEHFSDWPRIRSVVVSPSGQRLAMLLPGPAGFNRLGVIDLDPVGAPRIIESFGDADIRKVRWVTDDRLVYEAFQPGPVVVQGGGGAYAINHDATERRQLVALRSYTGNVSGTLIASRILPEGWVVDGALGDGSNDISVYRQVRDEKDDVKSNQLARLNTSTGALTKLSMGMPEGVRGWLLDAKNEPRVAWARLAGRYKVYSRASGSTPWVLLADFDQLDDAAFAPWMIEPDGGLLVTARRNDVTGLYRLDPATKDVQPAALVTVKGFDLKPERQIDLQSGRLLGVHFEADREVSYWFDTKLQRVQDAIDAALPGRSNRIYCGRCESQRFFVVRSRSDRQPGEYFVFDREATTLSPIGESRPWISEAAQGTRTFHRVVARDGLSIPVYATHPAGATDQHALPAVVLVHRGPWLRGSGREWSADAQFLASRGYRVIEPEFRGSEGYGQALFRAGWKQWGRAMQDDLIDAVQWATKAGWVDAGRVCIMGAGYGGYAALMGPIAHPGAYRCAISFAGATDIDLMYDITWGGSSDRAKRYTMPVLIGDPVKDAAALAAASPLKRASEIKVPVLVAYGGEDSRVPMTHAQQFIAAARRAGVDVEERAYLQEGHGFYRKENQADYYRRVEAFLAKALKPTPPQTAMLTTAP